jgi:protein O-mannosyl-transferase
MKSVIFQPRRRDLLLGFVLFIATIAAYQPAWNGSPIWDDDHHITKPELRSINGLERIWTQLGATQQYYPLMHSIFWLEYHLWGGSTLGYHLVNILLHFISALLLVCILRRLEIPCTWFIAAIFALHPVQVESVAWISELKNTLSGFFFFSAILAYLKFDSRRKRKFYVFAIGLFILGLISKSVIAVLPVSLLIIFWWKRGKIDLKRDALPLLPFFVVGIAYGLFTSWVERKFIGAEGSAFAFTIIDRCLIAGRATWFYLSKIFYPVNLIFIYPRWNVSPVIWWQYLFPVATLTLAYVLWKLRELSRAPFAAYLFFMAMLFPMLGFFNIYPFRFSFVADHFLYLACIGPIVLVSAGIESTIDLINKKKMPFTKPIIYGITLLILCVFTRKQCEMYTDAETLFKTVIKMNPACWMAYNNLGNIYTMNGAMDKAVANYQKALEIKPEYSEAQYNFGNALLKIGRTDEAIFHYRKSLEIKSDFAEAWNNLGNALLKTGQINEAKACYEKALSINQNYVDAHTNIGVLLVKTGQNDEAIAHYQKALDINPNYGEAHFNLGNVLLKTGHSDEAIAHYRKSLEIKPGNDEAHCSLGILLAENGQTNEAITHFQKAIEINPNNDEAHYNFGILLAQSGRTAEAIAQYQKALEINPNNSETHSNLGVLLMNSGRTEEAIFHYQKALQINPNYAEAHNNLGNALFKTERLNEAIDQYKKALEINPTKINTLENLATIFMQKGQKNNAISILQKALNAAKLKGQEPQRLKIASDLESIIRTHR